MWFNAGSSLTQMCAHVRMLARRHARRPLDRALEHFCARHAGLRCEWITHPLVPPRDYIAKNMTQHRQGAADLAHFILASPHRNPASFHRILAVESTAGVLESQILANPALLEDDYVSAAWHRLSRGTPSGKPAAGADDHAWERALADLTSADWCQRHSGT